MPAIIFFLSDRHSIIEVMNAFDKFSLFFGLKSNAAKCGITGISTLKGVSLALSGMDWIGLIKTMKILGIHFSYNKET